MFPEDETDLPSRSVTVVFCALFGTATAVLASLIHNLPAYHSERRGVAA